MFDAWHKYKQCNNEIWPQWLARCTHILSTSKRHAAKCILPISIQLSRLVQLSLSLLHQDPGRIPCGCGIYDILKGHITFVIYTVDQKTSPIFLLQVEEGLSDFNNFWYEYSQHNWPSNGHSISHLTQSLLLHYQNQRNIALYPRQYYYLIKKKKH